MKTYVATAAYVTAMAYAIGSWKRELGIFSDRTSRICNNCYKAVTPSAIEIFRRRFAWSTPNQQFQQPLLEEWHGAWPKGLQFRSMMKQSMNTMVNNSSTDNASAIAAAAAIIASGYQACVCLVDLISEEEPYRPERRVQHRNALSTLDENAMGTAQCVLSHRVNQTALMVELTNTHAHINETRYLLSTEVIKRREVEVLLKQREDMFRGCLHEAQLKIETKRLEAQGLERTIRTMENFQSSLKTQLRSVRFTLQSTITNSSTEFANLTSELEFARGIIAEKELEIFAQRGTITGLNLELQRIRDSCSTKVPPRISSASVNEAPPNNVTKKPAVYPYKHVTASTSIPFTNPPVDSLTLAFGRVAQKHGSREAFAHLQSRWPVGFFDVVIDVLIGEIETKIIPDMIKAIEGTGNHPINSDTSLADIWNNFVTFGVGKVMLGLLTSPGDQNGTLGPIGEKKLIDRSAIFLLILSFNRDARVAAILHDPLARLLRSSGVPVHLAKPLGSAGLAVSNSTAYRHRSQARAVSRAGIKAFIEYALRWNCPLTFVFDNVDWQRRTGIHILGGIICAGKPPQMNTKPPPQKLIHEQTVQDYMGITTEEAELSKSRWESLIAVAVLLSVDPLFRQTVAHLAAELRNIEMTIEKENERSRDRRRGRRTVEFRKRALGESKRRWRESRVMEAEKGRLIDESSGPLMRIKRQGYTGLPPGDENASNINKGPKLLRVEPGEVVQVHSAFPDLNVAVVTTVSKGNPSYEPMSLEVGICDEPTPSIPAEDSNIAQRTRSNFTNAGEETQSEMCGIIDMRQLVGGSDDSLAGQAPTLFDRYNSDKHGLAIKQNRRDVIERMVEQRPPEDDSNGEVLRLGSVGPHYL